MSDLFLLLLLILLGLIPAAIAKGKGRSFAAWWIYGAALLFVALPHSLLMNSTNAQQTTEEGSTRRKEEKRMKTDKDVEERKDGRPQTMHAKPKWDMKTVAKFLIIVGCLGVGGALMMDTSVSSGLGRVQNLGLMEDRRNYLMIAGLLTIVGVILFVSDRVMSQRVGQVQLATGPDQTPREFPVDRNLDSDAYQLYLVKNYAIEKNQTLEKYVVNEKLFASVDDALRHAHSLDLAAEELEAAARRERQAPIERRHDVLETARGEKLSGKTEALVAERISSQPRAQVPMGLESWIARLKSGEPLAVLLQDLQAARDRREVTPEQFTAIRGQLLM